MTPSEFLPWISLAATIVALAMNWQRMSSAVERIDKSIDNLNTDAKKIPAMESELKLLNQAMGQQVAKTNGLELHLRTENARLETLVRERTHKLSNELQAEKNESVLLKARIGSLEGQLPMMKAIETLTLSVKSLAGERNSKEPTS